MWVAIQKVWASVIMCTPLVETGVRVFFDNWFTSSDLLNALKTRGLHSVGTVRINGCTLKTEKEIKLERQRSSGLCCRRIEKCCGCQMYEEVTLLSLYAGVEPLDR